MSAHVHAQSTYTIPKLCEMKDVVSSKEEIIYIVELQKKTSDALGAFLLAIYGRNWHDLNPELYQQIRLKMGKKAPTFFNEE